MVSRDCCDSWMISNCTDFVALEIGWPAAFFVIIVAGYKQSQMAKIFVVVRCGADRKRLGDDFTPIIYIDRVRKLQAGTWRDQFVQVQYAGPLLPQEGMQKVCAVRRSTDDLTPRIDAAAAAARVAVDRSEIMDHSIFPKDGIVENAARKIG